MNIVTVNAEARDLSQKAAAIRKAGRIPGVIYGGNENIHFTTTLNDIKSVIYTPDFKLAEIDLGGNKQTCILKDVQFHPLTDNVEHIDLLQIEEGRKVKVEIPVRFKGTSPGVKGGGKLIQSLRKVQVKLDPKDLVDELFIDISELELGSAVRVRDIEINDAMELMVNPSIPVAVVEVPRALKSAEAAAEGLEGEAAEGEAVATEEAEA